jgi:hypothetical protein
VQRRRDSIDAVRGDAGVGDQRERPAEDEEEGDP